MKISNAKLAEIVELCFDLSMDGRLSPEMRQEFMVLGKRLRGSLLNLISAEFEKGTSEFTKANAKIEEINKDLKNATQALDNTAKAIGQLGELVSILDDLLKIASSFV